MYSTRLELGLNSISTTGKQASSQASFLATITEISFLILTFSSIKHSTSESIERFEQGEITEQNFRNNSKSKKKRDEMPLYLKKRNNRERNENLSEDQLTEKRRRDREYYEKIKDK